MRLRTVSLLAIAAMLLAACAGPTDTDTGTDAADTGDSAERDGATAEADDLTTFVVHRTETCGCCGDYEDYLEEHGFVVDQRMHDDVRPIREGFGIPSTQASCHTGEVGPYAVEGHVPMQAIAQLLEERPDVDGIALAGMPVGSPGMPGEQEAPFVVTLIDDGEVVGELGRF